jgi:hypothetical protein
VAYAVHPNVGPWMICVKSYMYDPQLRGEDPRVLAEELAAEIRTRHKIQSWIHVHGREERLEEERRIEAQKRQHEQFLRQMGALEGPTKVRVRKVQSLKEQYVVLIGGFKDMEAARKYLDTVRKFPPPSNPKLMDHAFTAGTAEDGTTRIAEQRPINPFTTAFVAPNPTVKQERRAEEQADPFLKELNGGESLSVLRCSKPWTLMVRVYPGLATIAPQSAADSVLSKVGLGKGSELLNASALQARQVAELLRKMPEKRFEAYVLHTRHSSIVCVGQYDSPDDPRLIEAQRLLAGLKLQDRDSKLVLDQLVSHPRPMKIPQF